MLVLSRRPDEKIVLPTLGVTIHILRVKGNIVKIGIEAPPDVKVLREELNDAPIVAHQVPARAADMADEPRLRTPVTQNDSGVDAWFPKPHSASKVLDTIQQNVNAGKRRK